MNIDKMIIQSVNNINLMIDKEQMLNNIKLKTINNHLKIKKLFFQYLV